VAVYGSDRNYYISDMMKLSHQCQSQLKELIESLSVGALYDRYFKTCIHSSVATLNNVQEPPKPCEKCEEMLEINTQLSKDLNDILHQRNELDKAFRIGSDTNLERLMAAESAINAREEEVRRLTTALEVASSKVDHTEMMSKSMQSMHDTSVKELAAEMEELRSQAGLVDKLERKLERLHERLESLIDVKAQLTEERSSHSATQSQLMLLDREVSGLRKLKTQIEEYRSQYAISCVSLEEIRVELQAKSFAHDVLSVENIRLQEILLVQQQNGELLSESLEVTQEELQIKEAEAAAYGSDLDRSELNAGARRELETLRAENKVLVSRIDETVGDAVDALKVKLEDQRCTNAILQQKWFESKIQLDGMIEEIATLRIAMAELEEMKEALLLHVDELTSSHLEETRDFRLKWDMEKEQLQATCSTLQRHLEAANSALELANHEKSEAFQHQRAAEDATAASQSQVCILLGRINELEILGTSTRETMQTDYDGRVSELSSQHEAALAIERDNLALLVEQHTKRQVELSADVEEERLKRRKVDREKKFLETEVHRFKSAVQSAGGGGSQDVEAAHKELKSMQSELDAAHAELGVLRSRSGTSDTKEAPVMGAGRTRYSTRTATSSSGRMAETSDLSDKRIEQLTRERRELIAKNLEENKEKLDLAQKLLVAEREATTLRSKFTKLTLEKERLERKYLKGVSVSEGALAEKENVQNI
jgi:hypothetical protein